METRNIAYNYFVLKLKRTLMNTIKKIFLETLFVLILGLSSAYSQTIKVKKINNEFITQNEIYKTVTDLIDSASVTG